MPNLYPNVLCGYWPRTVFLIPSRGFYMNHHPYGYLKLKRLHTELITLLPKPNLLPIFSPLMIHLFCPRLKLGTSVILTCFFYPRPMDWILPQMENAQAYDIDPGSANHYKYSAPSAAGLRHPWIFGKWSLVKSLFRCLLVGHSVDPDVWLGLVEKLLVALLLAPGSRKELQPQTMESFWYWETLTPLHHHHGMLF